MLGSSHSMNALLSQYVTPDQHKSQRLLLARKKLPGWSLLLFGIDLHFLMVHYVMDDAIKEIL